jgi:hypothetical protein
MTIYALLTRIILLFSISIWIYLFSPQSIAEESAPADAADIQLKMQGLIDYVDSVQYAELADFDEHVVLAFEAAVNRKPKPLELALLSRLHKSIGLPRSAVLSYALSRGNPSPSWKNCREFVNKASKNDFVPGPEIQNKAKKLKALGIKVIKQQLIKQLPKRDKSILSTPTVSPEISSSSVAFQQYNVYFGYLHAHSALSDGEGTPLQAYEFARDSGNLDFFALTDHGELLFFWPWQQKWQQLKAAADATNMPDSFVSLWGFEWSNPFLGHMNVINSSDYTSALSVFPLFDFYDWITNRPEAFAQFNHPGDYNDLNLEFYHFLPYPAVREQVVGIETWNGNSSFDTYYYNGGYGGQYSFLDEANRLSWHLGALGSQDNHQQDWGRKNDFRTGVLATSLTRKAIIDAYKSRRFYATEDKDLSLNFTSNGYPMGSQLSGFFRHFEINACDGSNDSFSKVSLYRNGVFLKSISVDGVCANADFTDAYIWPSYYYVIVQQKDDNDGNGRNDEAISSPIWYL